MIFFELLVFYVDQQSEIGEENGMVLTRTGVFDC